jgi:beta-phosphoglucomutase family hydrolase
MNFDRFEALIFDMDGTLIDTMPVHEKAWRATLEKYELPVLPELMRSLVGVPTRETLLEICKVCDKHLTDLQVVCDFKIAQVKINLAQTVRTTPVVDTARQYWGKKPMAVGTGALTSEAMRLLKAAGIDKLFTVVIGADQVARHKPAPDTFLLAAAKLGAKPEHCAVFEDGDAGLKAAINCGMHPVDIRTSYNFRLNYFQVHSGSAPGK